MMKLIKKIVKSFLLIFTFVFFSFYLVLKNVEAKSPPLGINNTQIPANFLLMLDVSGSMTSTISNSIIFGPQDVGVDNDGNVFILEGGRCRIKKLDPDGKLLKTWGGKGYKHQQGCGPFNNTFWFALRLAVNNTIEEIAVTDLWNNRIVIFDFNLTVKRILNTRAHPLGVTWNSSNNIIYSRNCNYVYEIDRFGNQIRQIGRIATGWSPNGYSCAQDVATDSNDNIYVVSSGTSKIVKYSSTGTFLKMWGGYGSGNTQLKRPAGIVIDSNDNIYVSDGTNHRVVKYDTNGTYQAKFGGCCRNDGNFYYGPRGLGVDSNDNIYAADLYNNRVSKWDTNLNFVTNYGGRLTRIQMARRVIKKIVSNSDLTSGANFGLMAWSSYSAMKVGVSNKGAQEIFNTIDNIKIDGSLGYGTDAGGAMNLAERYYKNSVSGFPSPIDDKSKDCQLSYLILISDGHWWGGPENYARRLKNNKSLSREGVKTFVVGIDISANNNYNKLAQAGGTKEAVYASNENDLFMKISRAIREGSNQHKQNYTAPKIGSDKGEDYLLEATFDVETDKQWKGYLKKYKLNNGIPIKPETWDAGKKLDSTSPNDRKIWTVVKNLETTSYNNFTTNNISDLENKLFPLGNQSSDDTENLINFVRGYDVYDSEDTVKEGKTTATEDNQRWKLADIYNSKISVVGKPNLPFNGPKNSEAAYRKTNNYGSFISSNLNRKKIVIAGSNGGMLHAFDFDTGKELWAFIPPSLLPKLRQMKSDKANISNVIYGVDGAPIVKDIYYDDSWKTIVLTGLGEGGKSYFALDITDTENPKHLFTFKNNFIPKVGDKDQDGNKLYHEGEIVHWSADGSETVLPYEDTINDIELTSPEHNYSRLGDATSEPRILRIGYNGKDKWVAVFGAGENQVAKDDSGNAMFGSAVYVIDLEDEGKVLKNISLTDKNNDIVNAVPAPITMIRADDTSLATYKGGMIYVTDKESKLWKIDLTGDNTSFDSTQLFDSEATYDNQRFSYYEVGASVIDHQTIGNKLWLYYGTGNKKGLALATGDIQNFIYGIRDSHFPNFQSISSTPTVADCTDGSKCPPSSTDKGWAIDISKTNNNKNYRKVTAKPRIINQKVKFLFYDPDLNNPCNLGTGSQRTYNYKCGNETGAIKKGVKGLMTHSVTYKGKEYITVSGTISDNASDLDKNVTKATDNIIIVTPNQDSRGNIEIDSWRERY